MSAGPLTLRFLVRTYIHACACGRSWRFESPSLLSLSLWFSRCCGSIGYWPALLLLFDELSSPFVFVPLWCMCELSISSPPPMHIPLPDLTYTPEEQILLQPCGLNESRYFLGSSLCIIPSATANVTQPRNSQLQTRLLRFEPASVDTGSAWSPVRPYAFPFRS